MSVALYGVLLLWGLQVGEAHEAVTKPANTCTVEGIVLAAEGAAPLRKAWVSLSKVEGRESPKGATTDAAGRFAVKDLEPGRYSLAASRTGYVRQPYGQRDADSPGTILALAPGQHVRDVSFRLIRAAAISGHIYDEDGDPVQGVEVRALRYRYVKWQRDLAPVGWVQTDDLGEYRLYGLAPGQYYVSANYSANRFGEAPPSMGYAPAYYPGTSDSSQATPLTLRAGDDFPGVDFNLQPTRTVALSGRVFNAITGQPGVGANVFLMPRSRSPVVSYSLSAQNYVQDRQGNFKLEGVTPGSYYIVAMVSAEGKQYVSRQPVEVGDSDLEGINLVIAPGITVPGRLRVEGNADISAMRIGLRPRDQQVFFSMNTTISKADGSFVVPNVSDGSYEAQVWDLPEDAYLKAVRLGDEDVLRSGVEISGGQAPGLLEIVVSANGARVDGTVVKDQQPFSGATVVLVPDDATLRKDGRWFKQTTTDQYGGFTLRGIRPGEYKAYAWEKIEPGAYQDPSFLKRFEKEGVAVEIKEGSQQTLRLAALPEDTPP